jgi:predicted DCC family thiol-disulfide oxidoreductase YuxK
MIEPHDTNFTNLQPSSLILFDGLCGLCTRFNQFVMRRDPKGIFKFLPLQSERAAALLSKHGKNVEKLTTFYVVVDYDLPTERLLDRSTAGLFACSKLGGIWKLLSCLSILPSWLLDPFYDLIARVRYQLFGRHDTCPVPDPHFRDRFLS